MKTTEYVSEEEAERVEAVIETVVSRWERDYDKAMEILNQVLSWDESGRVSDKRMLGKYRDSVRKALPLLVPARDSIEAASGLARAVGHNHSQNLNKRWKDEELDFVIEMRIRDVPLERIASAIGRTTQSVATKLSSAVGVRRVEQKVRGFFEGTLNEEEIRGRIEGIVRKQEEK